jgi:hypothetical protein
LIKVTVAAGDICLSPQRRKFAIPARTPYGFGCWRYTLREWIEQN